MKIVATRDDGARLIAVDDTFESPAVISLPEGGYSVVSRGAALARGTWSDSDESVSASTAETIKEILRNNDDSSLTAALYPKHTGAMIALIPTWEDAQRLAIDFGEEPDELHVTLAYLGEAAMIPVDVQHKLVECVAECVSRFPTIVADAFAVAMFNPDPTIVITAGDRKPCVVLEISGQQITTFRNIVMDDVEALFAKSKIQLHEQYQPWRPHITLVYTNDADLSYFTGLTGPVTFDRVRLSFAGDVYDIPLGEDVIAVNDYDGRNPTLLAATTLSFKFDPKQPRDSNGQWTDNAKNISITDLTDDDKDNLTSAWDNATQHLWENYDDILDASPNELRDAIRIAKKESNLNNLSDIDAASVVEEWNEQDGLADTIAQATDDASSSVKSLDTLSKPLKSDEQWTNSSDTDWSDDEQHAVFTYTGADYEEINGYLSNRTSTISDDNRKVIETLRTMMRPAKRDFTVFRGVSLNALGDDVTHDNIAEILRNAEIHNGGFTSTSTKSSIVNDRYNSQVLFQINVPKNTPVLYAGDMTANDEDDFEMVIHDGARLKITDIIRAADNQTIINAEVVK